MSGFEWDRRKDESNRRKHGISFAEATLAFDDPRSLTIPDPDHSAEEDRWILVGCGARGRIVVVVHVLRGETVRIISARDATARETRTYEEEP